MRKAFLVLLAFAMLLCFALVSCDEQEQSSSQSSTQSESQQESSSQGESQGQQNSVTVSFNSNGGSEVLSQAVEKGSKLTKPTDPIKNGYTFDGWYANGEKWAFEENTLNESITLEAKWSAITYTITYSGELTGKRASYTADDEFFLEATEIPVYYDVVWYEDEAKTKPITKIEKGSFGNKTIYSETKYIGIEFEITDIHEDDDSYFVSGYDEKTVNVVIPSMFNGKPVVAIEEDVFSDVEEIETISIPDSVFYMGRQDFSDSKSLKFNEYDNAKYLGNDKNPYLVLVESKDVEITSCEINPNTKIICDRAFEYRSELSSITIPDSVITIGEDAFRECYSLESVQLGKGLITIGDSAFDGCVALKNIELVQGIVEIGEDAFSECDGIEKITIPDSVELIGSDAFFGCINLETVELGSGLKEIESCVFQYCSSLTSITIPKGVTKIKGNAFEGCPLTAINVAEENESFLSIDGVLYSKDKTVLILYPSAKIEDTFEIPAGVKEIGSNAFSYCDSLVSITIPDGVEKICTEAFYRCDALSAIKLPSSVTDLENYAFSSCSALETVELSDNILTVSKYSFNYCNKLKYNEYGNCVYLGSAANPYMVLINQIDRLGETQIHADTKIICSNAFSGAYGLSEITFPEGLRIIGSYAFSSAYTLGSVVIPNSVEKIENNAFEGSSINSITIGSGVIEIGEGAFASCKLLSDITVDAQNTVYASENGVLYSKDKSVLIQYPVGKEQISFEIPSGVVTIAEGAFKGSKKLESIAISDTVAEIAYSAFHEIQGLISISVSEDNKTYTSVDGNLYSKDKTILVKYANGKKDTSFEVPSTVTIVGNAAFKGAEALTSIKFNNVVEISINAFYGCKSLTSIDLGEVLTEIESGAFSDCSALTEIIIPESVSKIGNSAFSSCINLKAVNCEAQSKPAGWDEYWKFGCYATVNWGYTGE